MALRGATAWHVRESSNLWLTGSSTHLQENIERREIRGWTLLNRHSHTKQNYDDLTKINVPNTCISKTVDEVNLSLTGC